MIGETVFGGRRVPVLRFMGLPPSAEATGDIESMGLLAGQSVGLVREMVFFAAAVVRELVEGARRIIGQRLGGAVNLARAEEAGGRRGGVARDGAARPR